MELPTDRRVSPAQLSWILKVEWGNKSRGSGLEAFKHWGSGLGLGFCGTRDTEWNQFKLLVQKLRCRMGWGNLCLHSNSGSKLRILSVGC